MFVRVPVISGPPRTPYANIQTHAAVHLRIFLPLSQKENLKISTCSIGYQEPLRIKNDIIIIV